MELVRATTLAGYFALAKAHRLDTTALLRSVGLSRAMLLNLRADAGLARHARAMIEQVMSPAARTIVQEVEELILILLPLGRATLAASADSLGMNPRTLQHRLTQWEATIPKCSSRWATSADCSGRGPSARSRAPNQPGL